MLNIGTASQLAFFSDETKSHLRPQYAALTNIPYFNNTYLLVAVSMNGGNTLEAFTRVRPLLKSALSDQRLERRRVVRDAFWERPQRQRQAGSAQRSVHRPPTGGAASWRAAQRPAALLR